MQLSILLSLATVAMATPTNKCQKDACYTDVMKGQNPSASCSKLLSRTITGPPITYSTTVTVTTSTTSISTYTVGTVTTVASALPIAARNDLQADCQNCNAAGYSSVCSCIGVTAQTTTVHSSTTHTFTVTSTSTIEETATTTDITSTATVTAETSAAPCRIQEVTGTNQNAYLTSPNDSEDLLVQTTDIIGDAWYWYLDGGVLKTVNTTVIPHGDSENDIVVNPGQTALGNVECVQSAGLLTCHYANDATATIFVDAYDYVALYNPTEYAAIVADSALTMQATFKFDC